MASKPKTDPEKPLTRKEQEEKKAKETRKKITIMIVIAAIAVVIVSSLVIYSQRDELIRKRYEVEDHLGHVYSTDPSQVIKMGDDVNISYDGYDGDEKVDVYTDVKDAEVIVGANIYVEGFEEQLIGHKPGEDLSFTVTYPQDHSLKKLRGKNVTFKVHINGIYPPEATGNKDLSTIRETAAHVYDSADSETGNAK